jgi:hypothetical protein
MHDIEATGVNIDLPLMAFIKALYPTYSHYLESLQASGQMKSITFDKLVEKVAEHEKAFGKKSTPSTGETVYLAQKTRVNNMILPEEKAVEEDVDVEERISEARG